jgi:ATP-dependent helicase/nuclease subunit A
VDAGRRRYKDFLILTRKKKERLAPYADALEALNVPIEVSGAGAFGQSQEVEALTVLLRALADPQDALSLVAVLRGPLFGISDRELFAYKQSGGWFSIFAGDTSDVGPGLPPSREATADRQSLGGGGQSRPTGKAAVVGQGFSPADTPVAAALASLRQYHRWTRLLPAAAALDRILEHSGYLAAAATTPGGVEAGDLLHALDRVRQLLEDGGSVADAADALEADAEEASSEIESLPLEPGRTDVVRVMNLHKAKGLEADVVFLADPCGGFRPRVDVHIARDGDVPQGWFQIVRKSENSWSAPVLGEHADWDAHEQAERPFLDAEEDRLLYVAATRAREMLVVSRSMGRAKGTPAWGALNGALAGVPELPVPASVSAPALAVPSCSASAQQEAETARAAAHANAVVPSWSITSVTAEARHVAKMARAAEPVDADDVTRVVVPDTPSHRADAGAAWGTLIHGLLEHAMLHEHATREDLRRLAMWLTVEEPQLRAMMDEAVETVLSVRHADFWAHARAAEHSVETPFTVAQAERRLLSGVVDLLFADVGGWRVLDYKTDVALGAETADAYTTQLAAYERALRACGISFGSAALHGVRRASSEPTNE